MSRRFFFATALLLLALSSGLCAQTPDKVGFAKSREGFPVPLSRDMSTVDGCAPCHTETKLYRDDEKGEREYLWVDREAFEKSVHGKLGCTACHTSMDGGHHEFPLVPQGFTLLSAKRKFDPGAIIACTRCHQGEGKRWQETVHGQAILRQGIALAADCADCHGAHYIVPVNAPDSPVNFDNQPYTCTGCHSETAIVDKFGFANPRETYEESFHGKKQELGGVNKGAISVAVCSSCHGVHDIYAPGDPRSLVNDRNLSATCGKCHFGASYGFAQAFSHKQGKKPWKHVLLVVEKVYLWLILVSMAGFMFHMGLDFVRSRIDGGRHV